MRLPAFRLSLLLLLVACHSAHEDAMGPEARAGEPLPSAEDVAREINRLPPPFRERFGSSEGKQEIRRALHDKQLLIAEARRRGLDAERDLRRQVRELEERLLLQALLADEDRGARTPSESELRGWYETHREEFREPERVRLARVLVTVPSTASAAERVRARARIDLLALRLREGAEFATLAQQGDGPERSRGGDLGLQEVRSLGDEALERTAGTLRTRTHVSQVFECREGFAMVQLLERREARLLPYEEARPQVEASYDPIRKRRAFDALVSRLRDNGHQ